MENSLISVIIPIYNVEKYLNRCIESVVNQTYKNIEIILINDGSPDNSLTICNEWLEKDDRIKLINKENGGLSDARNHGIDIAVGNYITFVDSDDYIANDMLEKMLNKLVATNSDLSICGRKVVTEKDVFEEFTLDNPVILSNEEALSYFLKGNVVGEPAWDKLYKKEMFSDIRFPVGEINEDIVIMPTIFKKCKKIVHVGEALYYYCMNGASITRSKYNEKKSVIAQHMLKMELFIKNEYPHLIDDLNIFLVRYSYSALIVMSSDITSIKLFKNDYEQYYKWFKNNYYYFIKYNSKNKNKLLKSFLIYMKLYHYIYFIKNKMIKR